MNVPTDRAAQDAWVAASKSTEQVVRRLTARGETPGECVDIGCEKHVEHVTGKRHNDELFKLMKEVTEAHAATPASADQEHWSHE